MLEVIKYLQDNGFEIYVVSEGDRFICRTLLEGYVDIPSENIIIPIIRGSALKALEDCSGEWGDKIIELMEAVDSYIPDPVRETDKLRPQHLRSLTQLLERLPEFVFQTESKLHLTFQARVTIFRSIALF